MKLNNKLGFTLIELLVVITIIGILATGAVSVFTTQLQGARDSGRIGDMKTMETALHQLFSDNSEYPDPSDATTYPGGFSGAIKPFISKDLKDPKSGKAICWKGYDTTPTSNQACLGKYGVDKDSFNLPLARFKLGVFFEKETNFKQKAGKGKDWDGGTLNDMYEVYAGAGGSGTALSTNVY